MRFGVSLLLPLVSSQCGSDFSSQFTNTFIQSDSTIRLFGSSTGTDCLFKKYSGYKIGDEIWIKSCDASNANANKAGKYLWSFDESTGLVQSQGNTDFCWTLKSLTRYYKQRVKLANCDASDPLQQFSYIDGKIHAKNEPRLCAGFEHFDYVARSTSPFVFSDCYPTVFASDTLSSNSCSQSGLISADSVSLTRDDQTIKPFSWSDNTCLFKKYSGYNANDEVWLADCTNAASANQNKAGKFQWSFDSSTGLIQSEGSVFKDANNPFCLQLNSKTRFYKQRVKIQACDASNELQQFDWVDGRIHSRAEARLCAGYQYKDYAANGESPFIFSTCFPNVYGVVSSGEVVTTSSTTTTSAPTTTTSTTTTTTTTTVPTTEEENCSAKFIGCFVDPVIQNGQPVFSMTMMNNNINANKNAGETKIEFCVNLCKSNSKAYAGINRGNECFCGDSYGSNGEASDVSECSADCEISNHCGGDFRVSVHQVDSCDEETTTEAATTTSSAITTTQSTTTTTTPSPTRPTDGCISIYDYGYTSAHDVGQTINVNGQLISYFSGIEALYYDSNENEWLDLDLCSSWSDQAWCLFNDPRPAWVDEKVHSSANPAAAPGMNGNDYMFYTVAHWEGDVGCVGLGKNTQPNDALNPRWQDMGPVVCNTVQSREIGDTLAIDAEFFRDFQGKPWMVYGSHFSGIWMVELDEQTMKIKSGTTSWSLDNVYCPPTDIAFRPRSAAQAALCGDKVDESGEFIHVAVGDRSDFFENQDLPVPSSTVEAAFIYPYNGYYYLFVNWGACCNQLDSTYNIRVGRTPNLKWPFKDKNGQIMGDGGGSLFFENKDLESNSEQFVGPGHAGILEYNNEFIFSFHFYSASNGGEGSAGYRKMEWDADGWPTVTKFLPNFMNGCSTNAGTPGTTTQGNGPPETTTV